MNAFDDLDDREYDALTFARLVNRYRDMADAAGIDVESLPISEAEHFLATGQRFGTTGVSVSDDMTYDAQTLARLIDRYRDAAQSAGVTIESVTIGEALQFLATGTLPFVATSNDW